MKNIQFKKVEMENFCGYQDKMDYVFQNDKIVAITGPNGRGKSTIFQCIPYTLYGITSTGLKGDDVVNNIVGKNCKTVVEFSIDNDVYKCERYCKDSKLGNTAILYKNGDPIKKGHNEVVAEVERLIVSQKLFFNTLLFGQKVKTFFTDLTDSEQKDIFRKVLQLDNYQLYYEEVSNNLKKENEDVEKIESQLNSFEMLLSSINDNISNFELRKKKFEEEKENIILEKQNKIKSIDDKILTLKADLPFISSMEEYLSKKEEIEKLFNEKQSECLNIKNESKSSESQLVEKYNIQKDKINSEATSKLNEIIKEENNYLQQCKLEYENGKNKEELELKSKVLQLNELKNNEINKIKSSELDNTKQLSSEISNLKASLENYRFQFNSLLKEKKEVDEKISEIESNLNKDVVICPTCKQEVGKSSLDFLKKEFVEYRVKVDKINKDLQDVKTKGVSEKDVYDKKQAFLQDIDKNNKKLIEDINLKYNKEESVFKNNTSNILKDLLKSYENKSIEIKSQYVDKKEDIKNRLNILLKTLEEKYNMSLIELKAKYSLLLSKIEKELELIKSNYIENNKIIENINKIENSIKDCENEINLENKLIEQKRLEKFDESGLNKILKDRDDLIKKINKYEENKLKIKTKISILEFWKNGFSMTGIPAMLIDEAIPFMNKQMAYYLEKIGGRYTCTFDTMKQKKDGTFSDKISVNVFDSVSHANTRKQLSGGQTRIIDIATILTLRDLQSNIQDMSMNIILLDEIFDSLDAENIGYISNVLRSICEGNSINIISHTQIDQLEADETIRFYQN